MLKQLGSSGLRAAFCLKSSRLWDGGSDGPCAFASTTSIVGVRGDETIYHEPSEPSTQTAL